MKKIVAISEVEGEGLVSLLGKKVMIFCINYIYTGILSGVSSNCVLLEEAAIVYETGAFNNNKFQDAQRLPFKVYVQMGAIESFSETDKHDF